MEIWKDAVGYEGLYLVSNMGRIKSLNYNGTGKHQILKQTISDKGYKVIALRTKKGVYKTIQAHRLIALTFIPNPDNLPQINHINENKTDNRIENLEWCTAKYNANYGTRNERAGSKLKGMKHKRYKNTLSKTIFMIDKDTNEILAFFPTAAEAERKTGISLTHIRKVCRGEKKSSGGYKWQCTIDWAADWFANEVQN